MRLSRSGLLFVACTAATACSPTFDWREARPADGVTALFPCRPDHHTRQVAIAGAAVPMQLSSCAAGDITFAVSQVDVSDVAGVTPLMHALRNALLVNVGSQMAAGTAAETVTAHVPGATPHPLMERLSVRGQRADGSPLEAQGQFFCKGLRVYQATVVGRRLDAAAMDVFFSSLKLMP